MSPGTSSFKSHSTSLPALPVIPVPGRLTWPRRRPVYYHARLKPAGTVPYLKDDMAKAPRLFVKAGRFNGPQKAYYYFSDTERGAMQEIGKHGSGDEAQVAEIEGRRDVRLIDLSGVGRGSCPQSWCKRHFV